MLTKVQELKIIQQAEKANLSDEDTEAFMKWAKLITLSSQTLESMFKGHLDVVRINDACPQFILTEKGADYIIKNLLPDQNL